MKTLHMVLVLVLLSAAILGSAIYWNKIFNSFSSYAGLPESTFTINIDSDTKWSGTIGGAMRRSGVGPASFTIDSSMASACIQKQTGDGYLTVSILKNDQIVASQTTRDSFGTVAVSS